MESHKILLQKLSSFLTEYTWLLDCYVIEYFTEAHWDKLPLLWRESLYSSDSSSLKELIKIILGRTSSLQSKRVFPLSFLAFIATCHSFTSATTAGTAGEKEACPVTPTSTARPPAPPTSAKITHTKVASTAAPYEPNTPLRVPGKGLSHSFRRHLRPKKQHEIELLGKVVTDLSEQTNCRNVLDIGSGQGHLARYLAYHHGLRVVTIDAVSTHAAAASKYDSEVERDIWKSKQSQEGQIHHITGTVEVNASVSSILKMAFPSVRDFDQFIVVGLHTCGDLAPTILRLFSLSTAVVAVASVGCCYMKLTTDDHTPHPLRPNLPKCATPLSSNDRLRSPLGYPMSEFMKTKCSLLLSYEARELACHAVEAITKNFEGEADMEKFRVHCHRAAVEIILRKQYGLRRSQVRISKKISKLPFRQYSQKLLGSLQLNGNSKECTEAASLENGMASSKEEVTNCVQKSIDSLSNYQTNLDSLEHLVEKEWMNVLVFFMLRQVLAPCVEQVILNDRALFLLEQGHLKTSISEVFDATLSPRNALILSTRTTD